MLLSWFAKKNEMQTKENTSDLTEIVIPENLGMKYDVSLGKSVEAINNAFNDLLELRIKKLFFREHPNVSEHEYNLRLMELKRYFIICSLLKDVPMFSQEVDEVWHTMILSTRDYEVFSYRFMGEFLHHNPAITPIPNPDGRAWFDLIYTELFSFTAFTGMTWGAFYLNPLNRNQIKFIHEASVDEIRDQYFREGADEVVVRALISKLKKEIKFANAKGNSTNKHPFTPVYKVPVLEQAPYFAQAMIFFSLANNNKYLEKMKTVQVGIHHLSNSKSTCGVGGGDARETESIYTNI